MQMEVVDRSSSSEGFAALNSRHDANNQRRHSGSQSSWGGGLDGKGKNEGVGMSLDRTNCCASGSDSGSGIGFDSGSGEDSAMAVDAA